MVNIGKKLIYIFLAIIIVMMTCSCNKQNELRLRILANSNSDFDQQNKQIVKNAVKQIYEKYHYIDLQLIQNELKDYLNNELYETITIELKDEHFPAKSYNGQIIPSGIYQSIVITIGEGKGKNFWTMLYPEFYNISFEDDNEVEYHSYIYDQITK